MTGVGPPPITANQHEILLFAGRAARLSSSPIHGRDNSQIRVPAYVHRNCASTSPNLKWTVENGQIENVATGYCLDSGEDISQIRVAAHLYRNCDIPDANLK